MFNEVKHTISFKEGGNSRSYIGNGWSLSEKDHTWTVGNNSCIVLPKLNYDFGFIIELHLWPHISEKCKFQEIKVTCDNEHVGNTIISKHDIVSWVVNNNHNGANYTVINFEIPNSSISSSKTDPRILGLAFIEIRILKITKEYEISDIELYNSSVPMSLEESETYCKLQLQKSIQEIALSVESLGGNCEVGLFQRQCGVEPLGLYRFNASTIDRLVYGLDRNYDNLGEKDSIDPFPESESDWIINEKRYMMRYHTWLRPDEHTREQMIIKEMKRLPFLRRKFLEDLELGQKLFIYHNTSIISLEQMLTLLTAFRRKSSAYLLCVFPETDGNKAGFVKEYLPGLFLGFISHFSFHGIPPIAKADWVVVIANALLLIDRKNQNVL